MVTDFPTDKDIARIKDLEEYKKLFDGLHAEVFKIADFFQQDIEKKKSLYIVSNFPALISEYYADMIVGKGVFFDVENPDTQKLANEIAKRNDFNVLLYESGIAQSEYGFVPIGVREDDKLAVIEQIPSMQYFPIWSNDIHPVLLGVILAAYIEIVKGTSETTYLYKRIFTKENETVFVENELWLVDSEGKQIKQVALNLFDEELVEGKVDTGMTEFPIFQINNLKTADELFGRSDYYNILPQLKGINETVTQINIELRKNLYSRIAVPQGTIDKTGKIKVSEADIFEVGEGEKMPQYIQKSNSMIEEAFNEINFFIRTISAITKIPVEALGLEPKGGIEKVEAMRLRLFNTEKKVQRKRVYFEAQLEKLMQMALEIEGKKDVEINIIWDSVLPVSDTELTKLLAEQVAAGLKSKKKAIKELQGIDDDLLESELEDIANDNTASINDLIEPAQGVQTFDDINNI